MEKDLSVRSMEVAVTLVLRKGVTLGRYQLVGRQFDQKKKMNLES